MSLTVKAIAYTIVALALIAAPHAPVLTQAAGKPPPDKPLKIEPVPVPQKELVVLGEPLRAGDVFDVDLLREAGRIDIEFGGGEWDFALGMCPDIGVRLYQVKLDLDPDYGPTGQETAIVIAKKPEEGSPEILGTLWLDTAYCEGVRFQAISDTDHYYAIISIFTFSTTSSGWGLRILGLTETEPHLWVLLSVGGLDFWVQRAELADIDDDGLVEVLTPVGRLLGGPRDRCDGRKWDIVPAGVDVYDWRPGLNCFFRVRHLARWEERYESLKHLRPSAYPPDKTRRSWAGL